ncbi:hypothetical protein [Moorena sp. SIO4G3]|uniref:hypothetical protein n=1 Tax=Moorena sp. SIO4G3 TaxID=2607821 RepID=UPI0014292EB0|nr:hypothetical protein [Moorena sp. SIO4G3]NEO81792.1 hypothetical protein [Moorena sp. SIO4G3]
MGSAYKTDYQLILSVSITAHPTINLYCKFPIPDSRFPIPDSRFINKKKFLNPLTTYLFIDKLIVSTKSIHNFR